MHRPPTRSLSTSAKRKAPTNRHLSQGKASRSSRHRRRVDRLVPYKPHQSSTAAGIGAREPNEDQVPHPGHLGPVRVALHPLSAPRFSPRSSVVSKLTSRLRRALLRYAAQEFLPHARTLPGALSFFPTRYSSKKTGSTDHSPSGIRSRRPPTPATASRRSSPNRSRTARSPRRPSRSQTSCSPVWC